MIRQTKVMGRVRFTIEVMLDIWWDEGRYAKWTWERFKYWLQEGR